MPQQNLPDFDSLWDYSAPDRTETKFRELLPQFPENEYPYLELLTQIARTQGLQRKFDEAHQTLDRVEMQLDESPSRAKVRYLLERGRVFNSSKQADKAKPFFEQALDLAKALGEDTHAVDAIHMLAIIADPASALTLNLQAIQMAESSGQEKARNWLGSLYNNTGWAYHAMGEYESALEIFQKAEAFRRAKGGVNEIRIAVWCVARTLRSLNRLDEALSKQMRLCAELEAASETDGYVLEEIGECLLALKREVEAKPYFVTAYEVLSKDAWLAESEPDRLKRLKELGS
ncbi:MAG: tetratricopeptide repeat protein [Anaerolineales bacterium]|nr:tetratricopeptide repeat protein [Anaerolineales bacterium]